MSNRINTAGLYNNNYNQVETDTKAITFRLEEDEVDYEFQEQVLTVHKIISKTKYKDLNATDKKNKIRMKKEIINELFEIILNDSKLKHFVIFTALCYYFDMDFTKMLKLLSNKYKVPLINHLDKQNGAIQQFY